MIFDLANDDKSFFIKSHIYGDNICVDVKEYNLSVDDVIYVRLNKCTNISTWWEINFESEDEVSIYTTTNHYMYASSISVSQIPSIGTVCKSMESWLGIKGLATLENPCYL